MLLTAELLQINWKARSSVDESSFYNKLNKLVNKHARLKYITSKNRLFRREVKTAGLNSPWASCRFCRGRGPNGEAVLHTMYMDGACSRKWGDILRISKSYVDTELKRALEYKFGRPVPDPLDTVYQYWDEGAW